MENDESQFEARALLRAVQSVASSSLLSMCVTKTDGLTFKVSEIVAGVAKHIESAALDATLGVTSKSALAAK